MKNQTGHYAGLLTIIDDNYTYYEPRAFSIFSMFASTFFKHTNHMKLHRYAFLFILLSFFFFEGKAQLVVSNAAPYNTVNYLVQNVLLGSGVTVSNITYTGDANAIGFFNNGLTTMPSISLDSGIIIGSGNITNALGPNTSASQGNDNGMPSDPDLAMIVAPNGIFNAAILEFDFVPMADTVKFDFVFASEEYPEYTCCSVNDVFGFFISGSGISGPYSNNSANIALIPSTAVPIQINTVNGPCQAVSYCDATTPCCGSFPQYYVDNSGWTNPPTNPGPNAIQYDGFTTVLTAISPVVCGQTYHIKIAISDVGDGIFDSGVFLKGGSFSTSGNITVSSTVSYANLNDSTLYEGCGQACIVIDRGQGNIANPDTVVLGFSGTVLNGIDITLLPDTIFFLPGQDSVVICINGISDTLIEGSEILNMIAILLGNSGCSSGDTASLALYINDHTPLSMAASGDTSICFGNSVTIFANASGGVPPVVYNWSPATGLSSTTAANPVATPSVTTTYYVSITDSCYAPLQTDSVTVIVFPLAVITATSTFNCALQTATVCANGGVTYIWLPSNATTPCITVTSASSYTVIGTDANGCTGTTSGSVTIASNPQVTAGPASTICFGQTTTVISASSNPGGVSYAWSPSAGLSCATCQTTTANPTSTNTYFVTVTDVNGCTATASVPVVVGAIPYLSAIASPTVCTGETIILNANVSNIPPSQMPPTWNWFPPNSPPLSSDTLEDPTITPNATTNLYVVVTDAYGCKDTAYATVYVQTVPSVSWTDWTPYITCEGYVVPLFANISSNGGSVYWDFGDNSNHTDYQPAPGGMIWTSAPTPHTYNFGSTYSVSVVAINSICRDTIDTTFTINDMGQYLNVLPANVFTPNGDGLNDCFRPALNLQNVPNITSPDSLEAALAQCITLEIWDRWGLKMFESDDNVKCWNGKTKKGTPAKDGTYYYIARFKEAVVPGFIELLR